MYLGYIAATCFLLNFSKFVVFIDQISLFVWLITILQIQFFQGFAFHGHLPQWKVPGGKEMRSSVKGASVFPLLLFNIFLKLREVIQ